MIRDDQSRRRRILATGAALALGGLAGCSVSPSTETTDGTTRATTEGEPGPPTETAPETATTTATDPGRGATVETVVSIPGERVPENGAFDGEGNLYFGITAGEVRRLGADRTGETGLSLDDRAGGDAPGGRRGRNRPGRHGLCRRQQRGPGPPLRARRVGVDGRHRRRRTGLPLGRSLRPGEAADTLFVCNFANQSPDDGAILRTRVGPA